jgi:MFS family permease
MIGKKHIYAGGFVVFTLGSVLCGLASTVYWLIGFRVLQARGAAMIMALGTAIITEAFPPAERGKALGLAGSIVSLGIVIGPTVGGLLIEALSWHWIFFVNLPVGIFGTWMALRYVPAIRPGGRQRFDFLGALLLFISLLSCCWLTRAEPGIQQPHRNHPVRHLRGCSVFFIRTELHSAQPMVDCLFPHRLFSINLATAVLMFTHRRHILVMPFTWRTCRHNPQQTD